MIKKVIFFVLLAWLMLMPGFSPVRGADAVYSQLGAAKQTSGYGAAADPRSIAMSVIRWGFGLLGTIFVVLVLYAGYEWMTAGGKDEKIEDAKKLLSRAVIGLAIIFLSYSITLYVFKAALGPVTNPDRWQGGFTF